MLLAPTSSYGVEALCHDLDQGSIPMPHARRQAFCSSTCSALRAARRHRVGRRSRTTNRRQPFGQDSDSDRSHPLLRSRSQPGFCFFTVGAEGTQSGNACRNLPKKVKVLPIILAKIGDLPGFLRDKLFADFSNWPNDQAQYEKSLNLLLRAISERKLHETERLETPDLRTRVLRPPDDVIQTLLTRYLEDFWVSNHSNPRFARKSAKLDSYRLGKVQPFNAVQHSRLKQIDSESPVYPLKVEFTLVDKDSEVERMASDFYCYLDAFGEWRCSQWSAVPRRIG